MQARTRPEQAQTPTSGPRSAESKARVCSALLSLLALVCLLAATACSAGGGPQPAATATPTLPSTPLASPTASVSAAATATATAPVAAAATPTRATPPDWARDAVLYQIFVRAFTPEGTLKAAEARLPKLKDMGINLIYLMPIHPIGKEKRKGTLGSPYSVADYMQVDPALGTEADLKSFVDTAHRLGMRVIMDLVANHTAWDSVLAAQHPDWFKHNPDGSFQLPNPEWTDVIKLDYSQPGLVTYMITMTTHYVRDVGVDGFRCDHTVGVPIEFWRQWRAEMKKLKPDIFLLSENDDDYLLQAFDATYDQQTYRTLPDAFLQRKPGLLARIPLLERQSYNPDVLRTRFYENHDQRRAAYMFQLAPPQALQAASVYLLTTDDIPFIQNGQEVGITTTLSLFEPDKIAWQAGSAQLRELFKRVLNLRNSNPALRHGDMADAKSSDPHTTAFLRRADGQQVLVLIHFGPDPSHVTLGLDPLPRQGRDLLDGADVDLSAGIDMGAWSWRIIELKGK